MRMHDSVWTRRVRANTFSESTCRIESNCLSHVRRCISHIAVAYSMIAALVKLVDFQPLLSNCSYLVLKEAQQFYLPPDYYRQWDRPKFKVKSNVQMLHLNQWICGTAAIFLRLISHSEWAIRRAATMSPVAEECHSTIPLQTNFVLTSNLLIICPSASLNIKLHTREKFSSLVSTLFFVDNWKNAQAQYSSWAGTLSD